MDNLVSIITPTYNSAKYISETIESVLDQTHENWELLIVDDGSTDHTVDIIKIFITQDNRIQLYRLKSNSGPAIARNKGITEANGDYIAFLDADDLWKSKKLETQLTFMKADNCDVCFSSYELIDKQGNVLNKIVKALPRLSYQKLLKSNYIGNLTGMYNTRALGKITTPNLLKRQDWLLWLFAVKKSGKPAKGIQESLAYYRVHENSMSSNKWNLVKYNYWVYKKGLGFSSMTSIYCLTVFLVEHFFVKSRRIISTKKI